VPGSGQKAFLWLARKETNSLNWRCSWISLPLKMRLESFSQIFTPQTTLAIMFNTSVSVQMAHNLDLKFGLISSLRARNKFQIPFPKNLSRLYKNKLSLKNSRLLLKKNLNCHLKRSQRTTTCQVQLILREFKTI